MNRRSALLGLDKLAIVPVAPAAKGPVTAVAGA